MVTKGVIRSINKTGNRCIVWMPLFDTASSARTEAEAIISITPGLFNNLFVDDIVLVAFEENALEKPVIIGKLFTTATRESNTPGGMGIFDTLKVKSSVAIPASSSFIFPKNEEQEYKDFKTPKKMADYIKWLEKFTKLLFKQLEDHFRCFKNWVQWQLKPENVEIDDGDLDAKEFDNGKKFPEPFLYQDENSECRVCGNNCTKNKLRKYLSLSVDTEYPNT